MPAAPRLGELRGASALAPQARAPPARGEGTRPVGPGGLVHLTLEAWGTVTAPLQDGRRDLTWGLPDRDDYLFFVRPVAESAPHAGAHAGLYSGDGDAYDLRDHAPYDAPVFLLALPGSRVESAGYEVLRYPLKESLRFR